MATPVVLYATSTMLDAKPSGMPRVKFPLPPESGLVQFAALAFDQDFEQQIDQFPPAPKNTPAVSTPFSLGNATNLGNANAILTSYSQPQIMGGGIGKYAGTFNLVPASWDDFSKVQPYTFPGFPGIIGQTGSRDIFTNEVTVRIRSDYFVLDPNGVLNAGTPIGPTAAPANGTVNDSAGNPVQIVGSLGAIPIFAKSIFVVALAGTPDFTNYTMSIVPAGGKVVGSQTYYQTLPQLATYQTFISNAKANAWASTAWNGTTDTAGTIGQLISRESQIIPYAGNIFARQTMYVLAK